jgi:hypothetical protein
MPFGKYKGRSLTDIPTGYLNWLLANCDLDHWLQGAVRNELVDRAEYVTEAGETASDLPAHLPAIVRQWYREMSLRYHPDRGGSNEAMKAIIEAHGRLRELLGIAE